DHLDVRRGPHRLRARGAVRRQARREPHLQGLRAAAVRRRFLTCNLLTRKADSMTEQISSLKALILSSNDRKFEDVEIPEWGGVKVRVKALTDAQLGEYQGKTMALKSSGGDNVEDEMRHHRTELLVKCLFDADTDTRLFTDTDAKALSQKNAGVVNALFLLVHHLSDLDKSFDEKVQEAKGNSEGGQS